MVKGAWRSAPILHDESRSALDARSCLHDNCLVAGSSRSVPSPIGQVSKESARMKTYKIAAIPGDGIGTEVISAGVEVLHALAKREGALSGMLQMEFQFG